MFSVQTSFVLDQRNAPAVQMAPVAYIVGKLNGDVGFFRSQSIRTQSMHVGFEKVPEAQPLHDAEGHFLGFDMYDFLNWADGSRKRTRVRVEANGDVRVQHLGRWAPVSAWLAGLRAPKDPALDMEPAVRAQHRAGELWDWWKTTGKVFRILDLPTELREAIYGFHWGSRIEPFPGARCRRLPPLEIRRRLAAMPSPRCLYLNRQMYSEARGLLFAQVQFFVEHDAVLQRITRGTQNGQGRPLPIRQLRLYLREEELVAIFQQAGRTARALREMPLTRLCLQFWHHNHNEVVAAGRVLEVEPAWKQRQDASVQRTWDAAWPFIRGHPIELAGCVSPAQRKALMEVNQVERARIAAWRDWRKSTGLDPRDHEAPVAQFYAETEASMAMK